MKKIMISICITICVILLILLIIMFNNKNSQHRTNNVETNGDSKNITYTTEKLRDATKFYAIEKCIQENKDQNFVAKEMNVLDEYEFTSYAVYGKSNNADKYYIVRTDLSSDAFRIEDVNVSNIDSIDLKTNLKEIKDDCNNKINYSTITPNDMGERYLQEFLNLEISNPEEAYKLLDENSKKNKFSTLDDYKDYIKNNLDKIKNESFKTCNYEYDDDYTMYWIETTENNMYTFKENSIENYTVLITELN